MSDFIVAANCSGELVEISIPAFRKRSFTSGMLSTRTISELAPLV
jgi:hypothetical protein